MRFIDLFCGIGSFALALRDHDCGHQCVLACDICPDARATYLANHGLEPRGDVRSITAPPRAARQAAGLSSHELWLPRRLLTTRRLGTG